MSKVPCPPPRFLSCSENSRDLGGIPTEDEQVLIPSRLFRSGHLFSLSLSDEARLRSHGISDIIDFRSSVEQEEKPDRIPAGITFHSLPVVEDLIPGITRESIEDPRNGFARPDYAVWLGNRGRNIMRSLYPILIRDEHSIRQLRKFFQILLEAKGGVLWHCAMGKDRTGVATALILTALHVSYEEVLRDYLYTSVCCAEEIRKMTEDCRVFTDDPSVLESVFWLNTTHRSYLGSAFSAMTEMAGSPQQYIRDILEIGLEEQIILGKKYLR